MVLRLIEVGKEAEFANSNRASASSAINQCPLEPHAYAADSEANVQAMGAKVRARAVVEV